MDNDSEALQGADYRHPLPDNGIVCTEWALDALFGARKSDAWIAVVGDVRDESSWSGARYAVKRVMLQTATDHGHYVLPLILTSAPHRRAAESAAFIVLNNVGDPRSNSNVKVDRDWTDMFAPVPTLVVETSSNNFQYIFAFEKPIAPETYQGLVEALKADPWAGRGIADENGRVRYARLSSGRNPKPGKEGFVTQLVEASGRKYTVDEFVHGFGLEEAIKPAASKPPPADLVRRRQWIGWRKRWDPARGKYDKLPVCIPTNEGKGFLDPGQHVDYDQAVAAVRKLQLDGVGLVLLKGGGLIGGDLDGCRNLKTGKIASWAKAVVDLKETYCEISPSGMGIHFFAQGELPGGASAITYIPAGVELYSSARFFTFTGDHLPRTPVDVRPAGGMIAALIARVGEFKAKASQGGPGKSSGGAGAGGGKDDDAEARRAAYAQTFLGRINTRAFANLAAWVLEIFPTAVFQPGTKAYRVSSKDLGRPELEEDLSISPQGAVDFGVHDMGDKREGKRSAIDLVIEYVESIDDATAAALWLAERLGIDEDELKAMGYGGGGGSGASSAGSASAPAPWPTIEVKRGYIARTIDDAEAALLASGLPIFERARMLVHPIVSTLPAANDLKTDVVTFKAMAPENIIYMLNKHAATFTQYDGRKKKMVVIDPPLEVAKGLLAKGQWTFPTVTGVITVPTMRPDGSLLDAPGYDEATQLWYAPDRRLAIKPIKAKPTKADAEQTLTLLEELLAEFPFVAPLDRSVSLAALMTPVLRGAFDVGPLNFIRAHTAGTGKSYFINLISRLVTARPCPVITEAKTIEELEKKIDAMILQGVQIISIDNCLYNIGGAKLCQATEQQIVGVRILGVSQVVSCEWRGTMYANGNNVGCTADMTRRVLYLNMDAGVEDPEFRQFKKDPVKMVLADRWKYLAAVLTIARAWRAAGCPGREEVKPIASYGQWSDAVRLPLMWLGKEDPVESMEEARDEDPERASARALLSFVREFFAAPPMPDGSPAPDSLSFDVPGLVEQATAAFDYSQQMTDAERLHRREFYNLLIGRCPNARGLGIENRKVGHWLKAIRGQVHQGHRLMVVQKDSRTGAWYAVRPAPGGGC